MQKIFLRLTGEDKKKLNYSNPLITINVTTLFQTEFDLENTSQAFLEHIFEKFVDDIQIDKEVVNLERYDIKVVGDNIWIRSNVRRFTSTRT